MRTVVIVRPVDYFEIGVFVYSVLWGVFSLLRFDIASMALRAYPGIGGRLFLILLIMGGGVGLYSWTLRTITGPRLELAALSLLAILCLAYVVWTPFSVGVRGMTLLLGMAILIAGPGSLKALRLRRDIRQMENLEKQVRSEDTEG